MLATVAQYRLVTGDTTSDPSTVSAAIVESQEVIGEALERWLESAEYTETLLVQSRGRVFPRAIPVTSISATSTAGGELLFGGFAVRVTSSPGPVSLIELGDYFDSGYADSLSETSTVDLTYTGAYTAATVPATLRRGICRLARGVIASPASGGTARPSGATSVSLGDASVSYSSAADAASGAASLIEALVPGLFASLSAYRHPEAA